ncbi:MAG TPA: permease-like cell division protein FtsX [Candidatus Saccharimonadales bacterium]|nr:permease-like cell division protein FtsX [Candidatus Saccharimonadales bacterium]
MLLLTLSRTFKSGFQHFRRNGWLSFAVISIISLTLLIISTLIVLSIAANLVIRSVQDKVDISVYFKSDTEESKIMEFRSTVLQYKEVKSADYVSKNRALDEFKSKNADNPTIMQSIDAIGDNPLNASVNIKAVTPDQYDTIATAVQNSAYKDYISRINYAKNKIVIERLNNVLSTTRNVGAMLATLFSLIAVLITFNAIRITIYAHRQEIEIMRLVGASNPYIRMPFIFEGIIYGTISAVVVMLFLFPLIKFVAPYLGGAVSVQEVQANFMHNIWLIFLIQLITGVALGTISSLIAIRRYLKA